MHIVKLSSKNRPRFLSKLRVPIGGINLSPELAEVGRKLELVTSSFTEEDWLRAPPGKWCSLLVLEHLLLSYLSTTLGLLNAIHAGKTPATAVKFKVRFAKFVVITLGYFPQGRAAPPQAVPKGHLKQGSLPRVLLAMKTMDDKLESAEQLFGATTKVLDHPVLGPLTSQEWRRFHRTHGLHHVRQMEARHKIGHGTVSNLGVITL